MAGSKLCSDMMREVEFPNIKATSVDPDQTANCVYLDHAGSTLVSRTQLDRHHDDLLSNLYGNPHSRSLSSQLSTDAVEQVRYRILQHFNTSVDEYSVIFTSGCTGALKLVADSFDFHCDGCHGDRSSDHGNAVSAGHVISGTQHEEDLQNQNESNHHHSELSKLSNGVVSQGQGQIKQGRCYNGAVCGGKFTYLLDNHTSVQGMRELAFNKAGQVSCIDCDEQFNIVPSTEKILHENKQFCNEGHHLFAYPAQSNFSGGKYPLDWVSLVQKGQMELQRSDEGQCKGRWFVVLDAACLVSTSALDLGKVKPDFVTLSFYKMFGFPTGLGALLVRNSSGHVMKKTYFGGGTVSVSLPTQRFHVSRSSLSDRFEDGTISFLSIIALRHGFHALETIAGGMSSISQHTYSLAQYFYRSLTSCCHGSGSPLAEVYCNGNYDNMDTQGGIVNFNLRRANGDYIGFAEVDKLSQLYNIHVRTGCFCNIGACQKFLGISDKQIRHNFDAGHSCGDDKDLVDGKPTGSVRVSFGYMSNIQDAQRCLQFIVDCFLENTSKPVFWSNETVSQSQTGSKVEMKSQIGTKLDWKVQDQSRNICDQSMTVNNVPKSRNVFDDKEDSVKAVLKMDAQTLKKQGADIAVTMAVKHPVHTDDWSEKNSLEFVVSEDKHLSDIFLYPVKSCAAFKVESWPVSGRGLLYDREWMIVTESGIAMSQKRENKLCLLQPSIDLERQVLQLDYPGLDPVTVPLTYEEDIGLETSLCNSKVCGDRVQSISCGHNISDWLSQALQRPGCRLLRQKVDDKRSSKLKSATDTGGSSQLSLANESQYLLLNRASVRLLQEAMDKREGSSVHTVELDNLLLRFRGNLIVDGCEAFEEEGWENIQIGNCRFMSQGRCTRCQMVCFDQQTGERSKEPLQTLAVWRDRKMQFGIHLCRKSGSQSVDLPGSQSVDLPGSQSVDLPYISVGDPVFIC